MPTRLLNFNVINKNMSFENFKFRFFCQFNTLFRDQVYIGNIHRHVGFMDYSAIIIPVDYTVIIASAVTVSVLLTVVFVLGAMYFMRTRKSKRECKHLLKKIDDMERDVTAVCREGMEIIQFNILCSGTVDLNGVLPSLHLVYA